MATIGNVRGTLSLSIGEQTLNLGEVIIPLTTRNQPRVSSGDSEVTIGIGANLKDIRGGRELMRCHDCSCCVDPPCSNCVNCRHWDIDDCYEDCQTCEKHEGREAN